MRGNVQVRFGGGPTEKDNTYLPGGLPYSAAKAGVGRRLLPAMFDFCKKP